MQDTPEPDTRPADPAVAALAAMRRHYGNRYTIHHNGDLWVACDRSPSGLTAPTIIESTLEAFVAALESPGQRFGRPFLPKPDHRLLPSLPGEVSMAEKCSMCRGDGTIVAKHDGKAKDDWDNQEILMTCPGCGGTGEVE
ncbi:hypothetical protein SAMN05421803_106131 [Nocardiopsis flavescens]|uniref:Uncharacterized protein n=1 Tax=Nocardiopsis flavescens TaxID=758803 RepID=A0A1M6JGS2_9ACTN|nr:hypothetical protein [Nocardiopsis flavescens]SHJ45909.1 hypothetical protein SAMN05421803_106131 [Nocardiopsis flavescens]